MSAETMISVYVYDQSTGKKEMRKMEPAALNSQAQFIRTKDGLMADIVGFGFDETGVMLNPLIVVNSHATSGDVEQV